MTYVTVIVTAPASGQILRSEVYDMDDDRQARSFQRDMTIFAIGCAERGWAIRVVRSLDIQRDRCAVAEVRHG